MQKDAYILISPSLIYIKTRIYWKIIVWLESEQIANFNQTVYCHFIKFTISASYSQSFKMYNPNVCVKCLLQVLTGLVFLNFHVLDIRIGLIFSTLKFSSTTAFFINKWNMFWRLVKCNSYVEVPEVWHPVATTYALSVGFISDYAHHPRHCYPYLTRCLIPRKHNVMSANMCTILTKR